MTLSLAACASGPNAAEQVIGTEGTVAMEDLTPSSDADKEAIGYQLEAPEAGEEICVLKTNYGDIKLRFFPDAAPKAVYNFKSLALSGYYDGLTFPPRHRRICMIAGPAGPGGHARGPAGQSIWGRGGAFPAADVACADRLGLRPQRQLHALPRTGQRLP